MSWRPWMPFLICFCKKSISMSWEVYSVYLKLSRKRFWWVCFFLSWWLMEGMESYAWTKCTDLGAVRQMLGSRALSIIVSPASPLPRFVFWHRKKKLWTPWSLCILRTLSDCALATHSGAFCLVAQVLLPLQCFLQLFFMGYFLVLSKLYWLIFLACGLSDGVAISKG